MYQFPYTNFHDLDLDWVINQVKESASLSKTDNELISKFTSDFYPGQRADSEADPPIPYIEPGPAFAKLVKDAGDYAIDDLSDKITEMETATGLANTAAINATNAANLITSEIANVFDATSDYPPMSYVIKDNKMYCLLNGYEANSGWAAGDVVQIATMNELFTMISAIQNNHIETEWTAQAINNSNGKLQSSTNRITSGLIPITDVLYVSIARDLDVQIQGYEDLNATSPKYTKLTNSWHYPRYYTYSNIMKDIASANQTYKVNYIRVSARYPDNSDIADVPEMAANVIIRANNSYMRLSNYIAANDAAVAAIDTMSKAHDGLAYVSGNYIEYTTQGYSNGNIALKIGNPNLAPGSQSSLTFKYGRAANTYTIQMMSGDSPNIEGSGLYDLMLRFSDESHLVQDGSAYIFIHNDFAIVFDLNDSSFKIVGSGNAIQAPERYVILFAHSWNTIIAEGLLANGAMVNRVKSIQTQIDTLPEPETIPTYFINEANRVIPLLEENSTAPNLVVGFVTDAHYNGNGIFPESMANMKYVNERFKLDLIVNGGDMNSGNVSKSLTKSYTRTVRNSMLSVGCPVVMLTGNHDDNSYKSSFNAQNDYIGPSARMGLWGRIPSIMGSFLSGYNASYIDYPTLNIRLVFLDCIVGGKFGCNGLANNTWCWGYDETQRTWFESVLTDAKTNNMHVAVFSHMPASNSLLEGGSPASEIFTGSDEIITIIEDFIADNGTFIGWFNGHTHRDKKTVGVSYTNDETPSTTTFYQMSTAYNEFRATDDLTQTETSLGIKPARINGTASVDLWDVIIITPSAKTVKAVRFGAYDIVNDNPVYVRDFEYI